MLRMVDIIDNKRMGRELSTDEINFFISGVTDKTIPDYQVAALLMAICLRDNSRREISDLTMAMVRSGSVVDLSSIKGIKVDKHSTGGVGDTVTLIVAPIVAACGVPVAKMSGRGLGHTGGTLDKLEAIQGLSIDEDIDDFIRIVNDIGLAVVGQTSDLAPADKLLYAMRDVTATVNSVALIASSIMSKKLAAGSDAILLDVKVGSGAFMSHEKQAFELAQELVEIGLRAGKETVAVLSDMNQPLGNAVGNALEVVEAIEALMGRVKLDFPLMKLSILLSSRMLVMAKKAVDIESAEIMALDALKSGKALEKLRLMLKALGGQTDCVDNPSVLRKAKSLVRVTAETDGFVQSMDASRIGVAAQLLGAGRKSKEDKLDYFTGLVMEKRLGDRIKKGETLAVLHVNDTANQAQAEQTLRDAITIGQDMLVPPPLIYGYVDAEGAHKIQL